MVPCETVGAYCRSDALAGGTSPDQILSTNIRVTAHAFRVTNRIKHMRISLKLAALALTGSLAVLGTAYADDSFDVNQVSVAYSDGYMGTDHQFHAWEHRADAEEFRAKHLDRYHPWRHDDPHHKDVQ
jgi:hypothetical protein